MNGNIFTNYTVYIFGHKYLLIRPCQRLCRGRSNVLVVDTPQQHRQPGLGGQGL